VRCTVGGRGVYEGQLEETYAYGGAAHAEEALGSTAVLLGSYCRFVDWIEDVARTLDKKAFSDFIMVLWNIWNSRNNRVFRDVEEEAKVIWERVTTTLSQDFLILNLLEKPMLPKPVVEEVWKKPGQGVVKINFNSTANGRKMSFRLMTSYHDGFVFGGRTGVIDKNVQAEWAEVHTLEESINFAMTKNWLKLRFESDCVSLVNQLNRMKADFSTMGHQIREILKLLDPFSSVSFVWARVVAIKW
ncbi:hypothetical protein Goari_022061, partial [Gossypium aridum]|nr:hypothetical protein [Gossypium aridum]